MHKTSAAQVRQVSDDGLTDISTAQPTHTVSLAKIMNNTIISLAGQAVTWTSTLTLMISYGRFLGDAKFGELYLALTFVMLMGTPIDSSYDNQITRGVAEEPEKVVSYLSNVLAIQFGLWLIVYALALLVSWLIGYSAEVRILIVICGFSILSMGFAGTFAACHYAFEQAIFPVVGTILEKGLSALVGFLVLKNGGGVQAMAFVLLGGSIISGIWQAIWLFRHIGRNFSIDPAMIRELMRTNLPFLIYGLLGVIYYRIDAVLLSLMANPTAVGWYGASYRLFDTLNFLPSLVLTILYPVLSKLSLNSDSDLKVAVEKITNFLLFCGIPITTALITLAPNIISFLYQRPEFLHAVPSLQALAPGIIFIYINTALSTVILSKKLDKKIPMMAAIALVFNLGLNIILIPLYQHVGAALVTTLTEALLLGVGLGFIPKDLWPMKSLLIAVKAVVASLVMAVAIWYMRMFNLFEIIPVAMLVYLVVTLLLRTIPLEDLQALYDAMRKKARKSTADSPEADIPIELQSTLVMPIVRSTSFPTVSPYQVFIDPEITLKRPSVKGYKTNSRSKICETEHL